MALLWQIIILILVSVNDSNISKNNSEMLKEIIL